MHCNSFTTNNTWGKNPFTQTQIHTFIHGIRVHQIFMQTVCKKLRSLLSMFCCRENCYPNKLVSAHFMSLTSSSFYLKGHTPLCRTFLSVYACIHACIERDATCNAWKRAIYANKQINKHRIASFFAWMHVLECKW